MSHILNVVVNAVVDDGDHDGVPVIAKHCSVFWIFRFWLGLDAMKKTLKNKVRQEILDCAALGRPCPREKYIFVRPS